MACRTGVTRAFVKAMWVKRFLSGQRFAYIIVSLALLAGALTFVAFTRWSPVTDDPNLITGVLIADLVIVIVLALVIALRLVPLLRSKSGVAGSRLHRRLALFSALLAAAPTLFFAAFGGVYIYLGVQSWFNDKVQIAIRGSETVAQAYLAEHQQIIRADALAMASDLTRYLAEHPMDRDFQEFFRTNTYLRNLSEAVLMDDRGRTLVQSGLSYSLTFDSIPRADMLDAREGEVVLFVPDNEDRIRALVSLNTIQPLYLYVGRMVDETVLARVQETKAAADEYQALRKQAGRVQKYSTLMFVATGLLLVLAALWFGLMLARRLMIPLAALMNAAERVGQGDYNVRVPEISGFDEFKTMSRTFNTMTQRLKESVELKKQAAWGEVARRVAHEIKNPLTPIQLAAERLRRKYGDQITGDRAVFDECVDTIIKHVKDIQTMVDEFAAMGNMDRISVKRETTDLSPTLGALISLQREAYPQVHFSLQAPESLVAVTDEARIRQALLNLTANAVNALTEAKTEAPRIQVDLRREGKQITITVMDNGPGFPEDKASREKLIEPYVTTRKKGTGLGLAIVAKIASDLAGSLTLSNGGPSHAFPGAHAALSFKGTP